jgi:hypothetical protein
MGAPVALSEKTRAEMFNYFAGTPLGEEVTSEMLANFPMLEFDTLVTKNFLRAEIGGLRLELHTEIASVRTDMQAGFTNAHDETNQLRTDMHTRFAELRTDMTAGFTNAHDETNQLRTDMHTRFAVLAKGLHEDMRTMFIGTITTMIALFGILAAFVAIH